MKIIKIDKSAEKKFFEKLIKRGEIEITKYFNLVNEIIIEIKKR